MFEAYRVRAQFSWNGWIYAPAGQCQCVNTHLDNDGFPTGECRGMVGVGCTCSDATHCGCGIKANQYAGDIWIVEAGHPRKAMMLERFSSRRVPAVHDAGLPTADELLASGKGYEVLLEQWVPGRRSVPRMPPPLVLAHSRGGVALADRP